MIELSIVVVTFNENLDVLKQCFDSVADSKNISTELIVVDNGADDATRGLLMSYSGAVYLRNEENLGFAAAVNRGMKIAQGKYILLLNPDASFKPEVLRNMVDHLDQDENVGIASCIIKYPDGELQESIRRFPRLKDQLQILFKIPHLKKQTRAIEKYMMRDVDPFETRDVHSIMGAFMFIRRDLIEDIGYFDPRYFIWFEEVDYCKMAHDAGWKIRHYADQEILHHKGHAFGKIATIRKQRWIRSSLRKYIKKHHGVIPWLLLWLLTPIFIVLAYLAAFIKPR